MESCGRAFVRGEDRAFVFGYGDYCELYYSDNDFVVMGTPCTDDDDIEERDLTADEECESLIAEGFIEVPYTQEDFDNWCNTH